METVTVADITRAALKKRGWSDALIGRLLGEPDRLATNPHHRSGPRIRLYHEERVVEAEGSASFVAYQESRRHRSDAAFASADRRRQEFFDQIEAMPITVIRVEAERVLEESVRDWEDWQDYRNERRGDYAEQADGRSAPDQARQRWAVNYIRHRLTAYDRHLEEIVGKIGVKEAADRIHT